QARRVADDLLRIAKEEMADGPLTEGLRKRLLDTVLAYYQEFIDQPGEGVDKDELERTRKEIRRFLDDLVLLQGDRQMMLLREPAVLEALGVGANQREALAGLDTQRDEGFRDFSKLTAEQRQQRLVEVARAIKGAVGTILSEGQMKRLRQ